MRRWPAGVYRALGVEHLVDAQHGLAREQRVGNLGRLGRLPDVVPAAVCVLRPANIDGSADTVGELTRIVSQIRTRWPEVHIVLRADSGFARDAIKAWCEGNDVDFLLGQARDSRLVSLIAAPLAEAAAEGLASCKPARRFAGFAYATRDS